MENLVLVDPERPLAPLDRNVFGGFAEHLGRCIYGGLYEPGSPLADEKGFRRDVFEVLKRLRMPVLRYPGGNFVSGYRWMDGVGPRNERPARMELAWHDVEPNTFGTNEFIDYCRMLGTAPYFAVNCGDGDMREARDWLEYCNGTKDTALVRLRRIHGYEEPHRIKYWGIGNEVDGPWQIGWKTPQEYLRAYTEFAKVMKWTDPSISLLASAVSLWDSGFIERISLLIEQMAKFIDHGRLVDYLALHWYNGNDARLGYRNDDFASYMASSEIIEDRLCAVEGLVKALCVAHGLKTSIPLAIDEWNVWYRTGQPERLEEWYNLEDALVVAMNLNAFIRHAATVKMANIAQVVNVIAPVMTNEMGLVLQTTYHPFEIVSRTAGDTAIDVHWEGQTYATPEHAGLRVLDVSGTLASADKRLSLYLVNRAESSSAVTNVVLTRGEFRGEALLEVVNGPSIKSENRFEAPDVVKPRTQRIPVSGAKATFELEPHSFTAISVPIA